MPRVEELIDHLGKAKYLTTLDLSRGYWQISVAAKDQHKTAFATPWGLYEFKRMPFGLRGAPATFQRMIDRLLRGLDDSTNAYIDDIVIFSLTWEEHVRHITLVLERLLKANLTIKPKKCQFGMRQCNYLGFGVGSGVVQVEQA